jgi:predicted ATPase
VDWSYDKLADHEKALLRGLSIFEGSFSLAAAAHVTGCLETYSQTVGGIASLVSKSLVMRDFNPRSAEYRLAGITRAFAVEKLIQHGEYAAVADRYAGFRASSSDQAIMGPCE